MRKAKGSMFIMFVKAIRADKSGAFLIFQNLFCLLPVLYLACV